MYLRLIIEYPATGGSVSYAQLKSYKLLRYVTSMDYFVLACEVIFVFYLLYYTVEELIELSKQRMSYMLDVWNVLDLVVIGVGYFCVFLNIYRTMLVNNLLSELLKHTDQYANFEEIKLWQELSDQFLAAFVFVAWIKVRSTKYFDK